MQKSWPGAICSLFIYGVLLSYTINRSFALFNRNDYNILREVQNDYFNEDFEVTTAFGFRVAAAITNLGDAKGVEDPSIGTLEFYIKSWVNDGPVTLTKLKTRFCREDEFKFSSERDDDHDNGDLEDNFYPIHQKSESFRQYMPNLKCIDEDYNLYGTYNTNISSNLMIVFERCDP